MQLSIIIVNWNTGQLLSQCIESIYASRLRCSFEVLVVDNASTDGSLTDLQERYPRVQMIRNEENAGFAKANNQAIRSSVGRYILLLNPDTVVMPEALQTLVEFLEVHAEAGAVGPRLLNLDGSLQISSHPAPTLAREMWRLFHLDTVRPYAAYATNKWKSDVPCAVDVLQGACLLVRRLVLDAVGLFDEKYFIYSEEIDLCRRIQQAGWYIYWIPTAHVIHYGGHSTRQIEGAMFVQLYRSKVLYFRKHGGLGVARAYKLILFAAAGLRLLISPLAWLERSAQRRQHVKLARYYCRLLSVLPGL